MKIRIIGMLLLLVTLVSFVLVSCSTTGDDEEIKQVTEETRNAVTLNFYIVTDEATTEEAKNKMQAAFNEVCEAKYTTHVEFVFCTEDEYRQVLDEKYNRIEEIKALEDAAAKAQKDIEKSIAKSLKEAGITTRKSKTSATTTSAAETIKNSIGMTVLKYPSLTETQLDIVLVTDRDMLVDYVDSNRLSNITTNINGENKLLKTYISDTLLNNTKYASGWYAVPNNRVIGDYTYLFVNKEMADKYYYTESDFTSLSSCDELIELIADNESIPPVLSFADFPTLRYWSDDGDRSIMATVYGTGSVQGYDSIAAVLNVLAGTGYDDHMRRMFSYKEKGYFADDPENCTDFGVGILTGNYQLRNKYADDYYTVILDCPRLEEDAAFTSMLGVSTYTKNLDRAMEIITDLNTDSDLRNILQYGVEGLHFELDENTGALKRLSNDYKMNIEHTGNVFMAYPEEGEDLDVWKYGKLQNMDAEISITYGALEHWGSVNKDLMAEANKISKDYFAKMDACNTLAEYVAWSTEVKAAVGADNSVFQRLFMATDIETGDYDMTTPNGAMQYWYYSKYPLPD